MEINKIFDINIYESKNFIVNQDWEVPIPGFFILTTKRKIDFIDEFNEEEAKDFGILIKKIRIAMRKMKVEKILVFYGEDTPFGFHAWILPYNKQIKKSAGKNLSLLKILNQAKKDVSEEKKLEVIDFANRIKKEMSGK